MIWETLEQFVVADEQVDTHAQVTGATGDEKETVSQPRADDDDEEDDDGLNQLIPFCKRGQMNPEQAAVGHAETTPFTLL